MFIKNLKLVFCASGGMVYTLVLEANAERIESSSLSLRTINWKHWQVLFKDA